MYSIKNIFQSTLENVKVEKSFFFLVNPKFFKDTKDEYISCSIKREWTEKLNHNQLLSVENYVKNELPSLLLNKQKIEYIGCSNSMIYDIFQELRFTRKQFITIINKLFSDITYMSTYDRINIKEFINIEVDKVISENEKMRSKEKLTKIKKLVHTCITYFLNYLTNKGYVLEIKDNHIFKKGSIENVI